MAVQNSQRTHCVTFMDNGTKYFAVKSREYGDQIPMGVAEPEVRCAMSSNDAGRMAAFLRKEAVNFTNVTVHTLRTAKAK